jgi:hypothetical protein
MVLVAALTLLVLLSIASIVMSSGDSTRDTDPRDHPILAGMIGRR